MASNIQKPVSLLLPGVPPAINSKTAVAPKKNILLYEKYPIPNTDTLGAGHPRIGLLARINPEDTRGAE